MASLTARGGSLSVFFHCGAFRSSNSRTFASTCFPSKVVLSMLQTVSTGSDRKTNVIAIKLRRILLAFMVISLVKLILRWIYWRIIRIPSSAHSRGPEGSSGFFKVRRNQLVLCGVTGRSSCGRGCFGLRFSRSLAMSLGLIREAPPLRNQIKNMIL
jgi:hypothetical protein